MANDEIWDALYATVGEDLQEDDADFELVDVLFDYLEEALPEANPVPSRHSDSIQMTACGHPRNGRKRSVSNRKTRCVSAKPCTCLQRREQLVAPSVRDLTACALSSGACYARPASRTSSFIWTTKVRVVHHF